MAYFARSYAWFNHHNTSFKSSAEFTSKECHPLARILVPVDTRGSSFTRRNNSGGTDGILKMIEFGATIPRVTGSAAKMFFLR